jgi:hypothetical protein
MSDSQEELISRPDDHKRFEIVGRLWNDLLESDSSIGISTGGVQVKLQYDGEGTWSREDADRIAVYRGHTELGSWPLNEVNKA